MEDFDEMSASRPTPWRSNGPRYNEPSWSRRRLLDDTRRRAGAVNDSSGAGSRRRRARSPPRPTLNTAGPLVPPAGHPYPAGRYCKLNGACAGQRKGSEAASTTDDELATVKNNSTRRASRLDNNLWTDRTNERPVGDPHHPPHYLHINRCLSNLYSAVYRTVKP